MRLSQLSACQLPRQSPRPKGSLGCILLTLKFIRRLVHWLFIYIYEASAVYPLKLTSPGKRQSSNILWSNKRFPLILDGWVFNSAVQRSEALIGVHVSRWYLMHSARCFLPVLHAMNGFVWLCFMSNQCSHNMLLCNSLKQAWDNLCVVKPPTGHHKACGPLLSP